MDAVCETCRFWQFDAMLNVDLPEGEELCGQCRRFPPKSVLTDSECVQWDEERFEELRANNTWMERAAHSHVYWSFPTVTSDSWCGEHINRNAKE